ncbi:hypothetical protein FRC07_008635, partial [Ceratobasidium sp. 392]
MANHMWGPDFSEYSLRNFEPHAGSNVSAGDMGSSDVPPLDILEISSYKCDPRVQGSTVEWDFGSLTNIIGQYTLANNFGK